MGKLRKIRRALANGYRNWKLGDHFSPATKWGVAIAILLPGIRQRLDHGLRDLPRSVRGATLLDIGFGGGDFLELAKNAGWKVSGIDPDLVAVDLAIKRGLNVRLGTVESVADMFESFDVITMNHVIEHIHDPFKTLQIVYKLLKPGGFLWLSTPNILSFGHKHYRSNWLGLDPPRHLVLFNWAALEKLLHKIGFRNIYGYKRNESYANIAAGSEASAKSSDNSEIRLRHHLLAAWARLLINFIPHRTENITLKAYKL
jgi:2-polyprenyl-3-methyl-5-hydroxy-6-metoxy-1,4-benzoquinol methylase